MRRAIIFFALISVILFIKQTAFALDQQTHAAINEIVALGNFNNFSLNSYLTNNLGIEQGTDASFNGEKIHLLISLGGAYEDDRPLPYLRSLNHFHDPTKQLDQAGLDTYWRGLLLPVHLTGTSSILWALSKDIQNNTSFIGIPAGNYSWPATRDYFYNALIATDEYTRTENFVKCFTGIGQLMHLVEDASVPLHTRNEAHIGNWNYETWVAETRNSTVVNNILNGTPVIPYSTVLAQQGNTDPRIGGLPVSRLFDTGKFVANGGHQDPGATTGADIGLAEFTNANFFSERTGNQNNKYDYPSNAVLNKFSEQINDPRGSGIITRFYYGKAGDGVTVPHLAARTYFDYEYDRYNHWQDYNNGPIFLDETCYKDYATLLLPRAEGYAFSLMQYFFRGQMDAVDAKAVTTNGKIRRVCQT